MLWKKKQTSPSLMTFSKAHRGNKIYLYSQYDKLPVGLIAQWALHRHRRGHEIKSHSSLNFFHTFFSQLLKLRTNCEDLSSIWKFTLSHISSTILLQVTLPQLAALHHNNCMYIAHHLLTLGHQFRPKLPEPLNQGVASFVDLVPVIRQMGEKCFLEQLVSNCFSP